MKSSTRPCISDIATARVVRAARKKAKLSQEALAEIAGLHRTYVSLLERGRRSPTLTTIEAIGRALGMGPAAIIGMIAEAAGETPEPSESPRTREATSTAPRHVNSTNADR